MTFTRAKTLESLPCQVVWLGSDLKPLAVKNVQATLFKYVGVVRTIISGPVAMSPTDQNHRFITKFVIPNDVSGTTIFVEYSAQLEADDSVVYSEQTIAIDPPSTATSPSNIISVV
jgi:hypothetical protein